LGLFGIDQVSFHITCAQAFKKPVFIFCFTTLSHHGEPQPFAVLLEKHGKTLFSHCESLTVEVMLCFAGVV